MCFYVLKCVGNDNVTIQYTVLNLHSLSLYVMCRISCCIRYLNAVKNVGYIVMLRARMFRSLIPVLMIKERNIRARNITI